MYKEAASSCSEAGVEQRLARLADDVILFSKQVDLFSC